MKKLTLILVAVLIASTGFAAAQSTGKKLKTGLYIDEGARGGGVLHLARLLSFSKNIDLTLLKGKDLREGKLKGLDLLVMPGGSSRLEMESMQESGVKALQEFVKNGGAYVGICAGFHITLNRPERAQLMPYTYIREAVGYRADVQINISEEGAKLLDIRPGKRFVRYSRGPIAKVASWDKGECKTYALYNSSVGPLGSEGKSFFNTPALIAGNYGKGKVIATSFHPEYNRTNYDIFVGCVYYATGVKLDLQIPQPNYKALRVIYNQGVAKGGHAQAIPEFIALEKQTALSVMPGLNHDNLAMGDVLILPEATPQAVKRMIKLDWCRFLEKFMDRNCKIIAVGDSWKKFSKHKNFMVIKADQCLVKAVLELTK